MASLSSVRSRVGPRLLPAARWIAPSAVAACAGALVAGIVDGRRAPDLLAIIAAAGFFALIALPVLLAGSLGVRGLLSAWQPGELAARWTEADGAMPRLAGWATTVWLGALVLAWAMFQSTWLLAAWTAFKPLAVGFALPLVAVATVLAVAVLSRPAAHMFAAVARRIDVRWRRRGHRTLLRLRVIAAGTLVATATVVWVLWHFLVRSRIGLFDPTVLHAPLVAIAITWLGHVAWRRRARARALVGVVLVALAGAAIAVAIFTASARPGVTVGIWGARPLAGLAIETWFDLDAIRDRVPLADLAPRAKPGAQHPDILLVIIEGVRADRTPPYGGTADMPMLRLLGARGAVFDRAFAPSNLTARSLPAILTGTSANRVRARTGGDTFRLDPRHVVLTERMRAAGYETAGFVCCAPWWGAAARTGMHRGFDRLVIEDNGVQLAEAAHQLLAERTRRTQAGATLRPLFLVMHLQEPARWSPAVPPRDPDEQLQLYDRALTAADNRLVDMLQASAKRTPIVIVTSDHGEAFGDHDQLGHGSDLYNAQVRVPLVIAGPGIPAQRIPDTVSLVDLVPTVVELAGFAPPGGRALDGRSLASYARGLGGTGPNLAFATTPGAGAGNGKLSAVVQGRWKLIENGTIHELYDVQDDPLERSNQLTVRPEVVQALRKLLDDHKLKARRSPF